MALTAFQRAICRLIAANRIHSGESYVAGAVALNELIGAARISRDIEEAGRCVLGPGATPYTGTVAELREALRRRQITFHCGRIRGALPQLVMGPPG